MRSQPGGTFAWRANSGLHDVKPFESATKANHTAT
jgi:hypothetical protein